MSPINLSSVMIGERGGFLGQDLYQLTTSRSLGNGCTDDLTMIPAYYDMECTNVTVDPVLDISYVLNDIQRDSLSHRL